MVSAFPPSLNICFSGSPPRLQQPAVPNFPYAGGLGRVSVCLVMALCWGSLSCAQAARNDPSGMSHCGALIAEATRRAWDRQTASDPLVGLPQDWARTEKLTDKLRRVFIVHDLPSSKPLSSHCGIWTKTWIRKVCTGRIGMQVKAFTPGICLVPFRGSFLCLSFPISKLRIFSVLKHPELLKPV